MTTKTAAKKKNRLKELREAFRGPLTQDEVARFLGLDPTTVSRHETGERGLSRSDIEAYARLYKVSSFEIFVSEAEATAEPPKE